MAFPLLVAGCGATGSDGPETTFADGNVAYMDVVPAGRLLFLALPTRSTGRLP